MTDNQVVMRGRKRSLTLTEVLLGCLLLSALLALLFSIFAELKKGESLIRGERRVLEKERKLFMRLDQLFFGVSHSKEVIFFLEGGRLIFLHEVGADIDPTFSGSVVSSLALDEKGALVLLTWPFTGGDTARQEILAEKVERIEWKFFSPPNYNTPVAVEGNTGKKGDEMQEIPKGEWLSFWKRGYKTAPPLLRLKISFQGKEEWVYDNYLPATSLTLEISD